MIEIVSEAEELKPRVVVIGVGGAGGNAIANMIRNDVGGVEFVAANTDSQALRLSPAKCIVQLGNRTTQGLGAGSCVELGRAAAEESIGSIERVLEGAHLCFIAAGMGGGTGTGAAPVIAGMARDKGILTVGVVTKPFAFEGRRRARAAEEGLAELQRHADSLIVIPNQNLFRIASQNTTFKEAFDLADEVLQQGIRGITDLMVMPGFINLDFADVRTVMAGMGRAMMGSGEAGGADRALKAAEAALANPLLDDSLDGARGLLVSISGGDDLRLMEVDEAASQIKSRLDPDANIIWGSAFNAALEGRVRVSMVATGIRSAEPAVSAADPPHAPAVGASVPPALPPLTPVIAAAAEAMAAHDPRPCREKMEAAEPEARFRERLPADRPDAASGTGEVPDPIGGESPSPGPSLFERIASAARGVVAFQGPSHDLATSESRSHGRLDAA